MYEHFHDGGSYHIEITPLILQSKSVYDRDLRHVRIKRSMTNLFNSSITQYEMKL